MSQRNAVKEKERTIGNYNMGKTIGEGTFGKVRLGIHQPTGEKVAIKILEKDKIQEQADVERVAKEIQILKMLRHSNIIQLYEIIETPKELFLIMEYANGGELFDYIVANTRVKEREACRFFQQIIAGVEYIHKIGVVHRDLKPENLLLDGNQNIKIVDFGLSNTYKGNETLKTACGSPCYAAPEMIQGKRYQGLLVDIWSCGVIMFALICGYLPFEDPNTSQLYKKIIAGDFQIPKYISAEGKDLLKCILTTDPNKRITIQQIREHPWYKQVAMEEVRGIIVGVDQIRPDESLVEHLKQQFSIDPAQSRKMVMNNRHNNITTLYYLEMQKQRRSGKRFPVRDEEHVSVSPQQAQQGQQVKKVESLRDPPTEESPINVVAEALPRDDALHHLQREIIVKPKVHVPPMKLTFNPITQAVNNSISSVGTNTTTTPLATARNFRAQETSVDEKRRQANTDRSVVDKPHFEGWNNSVLEMSARNNLAKTHTDNSPVQFVGKSVSQHTEHSHVANDLIKRSYQGPSLKMATQETPTYSQGKTKPNQMQTINMSYFVQNKHTEGSDNDSVHKSIRSPQHSNRNKPKVRQPQSYQSSRSGEIKTHKGAFNLKCVSSKQPLTLIEDLLKSLQLFQVTFDYRTRYELVCSSRESTKFEIGVYLLHRSEGLHVIRGKLVSGDASLYQMYTHNIIQTMNL